jgi:hypothetical protein
MLFPSPLPPTTASPTPAGAGSPAGDTSAAKTPSDPSIKPGVGGATRVAGSPWDNVGVNADVPRHHSAAASSAGYTRWVSTGVTPNGKYQYELYSTQDGKMSVIFRPDGTSLKSASDVDSHGKAANWLLLTMLAEKDLPLLMPH